MAVEMKQQSQITIPNAIVKNLGINVGDKFEVMERDGGVFLCPVVVYPNAKLAQIEQIISDHEKHPSVIYESVEDMFKDMDENKAEICAL
jgi:bifunctional DNA-binding transcriptional regulator/antitoxin component of YhaV-PrlF toxin-antitoxin module